MLSHEIFSGAIDCISDSGRNDISLQRIPSGIGALKHACENYEAHGLIMPVLRQPSADVIRKTNWKCISTHVGISFPGIPQIDSDHAAAGQMAAQYLLDQGFESFGYMGLSSYEAIQMRRDGFLQQIKKSGRTMYTFEFRVVPAHPDGTLTLDEWLTSLPHPTAVYCSDDYFASELLHHCQSLGLHVPDQIAIIGTEDAQDICRSTRPALSSVHIPYREIGYEAMRLMIDWITEKKKPPQQTVIQPGFIAERASTDTLAIEDEPLRNAVRLLREQCTQKVSVEEIARQNGMSLRSMQHKFKLRLGHSPLVEQQKARVEQIKIFLRETNFTLDEIADKTGYANTNYLCHQFKKVTGQTAGDYRRLNQQVSRSTI